MKDKILECAEAFGAIGQLAEPAFTRAKNARFAYEQRKAKEWMDILKTSEKKPSDETLKQMVNLAAASEQKEVREAEASLEAVKFHYNLIKDTLSAYQTAAKFDDTERQIGAAGGYGA